MSQNNDENLVQKPENNPEQVPKTKSKKKLYLSISFLVGIVIIITVFYFIGSNKFDTEKQIAAFEQAVIDNDAEALQELLHSEHDDFEITEENTEALITYLNNNEDKRTALFDKFQNQAEGQENDDYFASIDFIADGKAWLIFDRYSFVVSPAYLHPMAENEDIHFYINEEDAADVAAYTDKGYGPVMPGHYEITAVFDNNFVTEEQSVEMELYETTTEEAVHSFDFPIEEIFVASDYDEHQLYVNGEATDIAIEQGEQSIGEFPTDGSVSLAIGKEFPWREIIGEEVTVDGSDVIELEIEHSFSEEEKQDMMENMNTVMATYQEALTASDAALLTEGATDNIMEKLENQINNVEEENPDYEGTLVEVIYDGDSISEPEFDEDRDAYTITMLAHHVFHEPNGDLGWLFRDNSQNEYTRSNRLTVIFNEETNAWELDDFSDYAHVMLSSNEIAFEL